MLLQAFVDANQPGPAERVPSSMEAALQLAGVCRIDVLEGFLEGGV